jgi:glycosyltransferase involved in cell wall biosynthesis
VIPRIFGIKTIVTVQGLDWKRKKWSPFARWFLRLCERASAHFPNATVVVSRTLKDYYWKKYSAQTTYIPNGLTMPTGKSSKQILGLGLDPQKYILFLGRLSPEKNVHLLIKAYERIDTSVKLVIAGGTSHTDSYVGQLKEREGERIRFLDWVDGEILEELLSNALLFVLPSDIEGLSLALLEAMGHGNCVLTSDIPENVELVDGVGYTFVRGDISDLERMLRLLLGRRDLRERAACDARARVEDSYLWTRVASETEHLYYQVLGKRVSPS